MSLGVTPCSLGSHVVERSTQTNREEWESVEELNVGKTDDERRDQGTGTRENKRTSHERAWPTLTKSCIYDTASDTGVVASDADAAKSVLLVVMA